MNNRKENNKLMIVVKTIIVIAILGITVLLIRNAKVVRDNVKLQAKVNTMYTPSDILNTFYVYLETMDTIYTYIDVYDNGHGGETRINATSELPVIFNNIYLRRDSIEVLPQYSIESYVEWLQHKQDNTDILR